MSRPLVGVLTAVLLVVVACTSRPTLQHGVLQANAVVERIVDGDTIVVRLDESTEKVRLIGIDTPESVDPRRPVECFGKEASAYLATLIPEGTSVRLELDHEPRDKYGRLLAYVSRASDGVFINETMLSEGYANTLSIAPNDTFNDRFRDIERAARDAGRGLWSACD